MSHSPQTPLSRSLPSSRAAAPPQHSLATRTPPPRGTPRRSQFVTSGNLPGSFLSHSRHHNHPSLSNDLSSTFSSLSSFDDRNSGRRSLDAETFEWPIEGLAALKVFAEDTPLGAGKGGEDMENLEDVPDVLLQGWMTKKGSFRLDLGRTINPLHPSESPTPDPAPPSAVYSNSISLYIGAYNPPPQECPFTAGIFVGITPMHSNVGQRYAETPYIWTYSTEHQFGGTGEYCPVELPLLSALLESKEVKEHDGFKLCIWVGSCWSIRPEFKVPDPMLSSTMRGLGRLLDRDTGDVRFVCLEHVVDSAQTRETAEVDDAVPGIGGMSLSDTTVTPSRPVIRSRKRVLYAHSDILEEKSDYFKDMLTSGFLESKRWTVVVDDASFITLYWVLRFVYTNELKFAPIDDVHLVMDQRRLDKVEITKLLSAKSIDYLGPAEWSFHRIPYESEMDDAASTLDQESWAVRSVSSVGTSVSRRPVNAAWSPSSVGGDKDPASGRTRLRQPPRSGPRDKTARPASVTGTPTPTRTRISANASSISTPTAPTSKARPAPAPSSASLSSTATSPNAAHATSPKAAVAMGGHYPLAKIQPEADPHAHPAERPSPASALEVYMLSDRYRLDVLKGLAKEHMLENMTCENCMPIVFASYNYDELHNEVLDFVVDHWAEVKLSPTFLRCIREVREDVWGESGPMVLHNIYLRL